MISAATAMHAVENNYRTVLIEDACRGVNEHEIEVKRVELNENGCIFVDSDVVRTFDCFVFPPFFIFIYIRYLEWSLVKIVVLKSPVLCLLKILNLLVVIHLIKTIYNKSQVPRILL